MCPSTEPWGTPWNASRLSWSASFFVAILFHWFPYTENCCSNDCVANYLPPLLFHSIHISVSKEWLIVSKALLKSIKTPIACCLSLLLLICFQQSPSLLKDVDLFPLKPCCWLFSDFFFSIMLSSLLTNNFLGFRKIQMVMRLVYNFFLQYTLDHFKN